MNIFFYSSGHPLEDLCVSLLLYPCVAIQMDLSTQPASMDRQAHSKNGEEKINKGFSMDSVPAVVINSNGNL